MSRTNHARKLPFKRMSQAIKRDRKERRKIDARYAPIDNDGDFTNISFVQNYRPDLWWRTYF